MRQKFSGLFRHVQTELMLILISAVLIIAGFLFIDRYLIVRNTRTLKHDYVSLAAKDFQDTLDIDQQTVSRLLADYAAGRDVAISVNGPVNVSFASDNFNSLVKKSFLESIWLYRSDGTAFYQYQGSNFDNGFSKESPLDLLKPLLAGNKTFATTYKDTAAGLKQLFIVPIIDETATTDQEPQGYLIGSRSVKDDYVNWLATEINSKVEITPYKDDKNHPLYIDAPVKEIVFASQITDDKGIAFKQFYVTSKISNLKTFASTSPD